MRSMTGYAQVSRTISGGRVLVELHSLNKKNLEIHLSLPKELLSLDLTLRSWIAEQLERGLVSLRVQLASDEEPSAHAESLANELRRVKKFWDHVALEMGIDGRQQIDLRFLLENRLSVKEMPQETLLQEMVAEALQQLIAMKEREGRALQNDFAEKLQQISAYLEEIAAWAPEVCRNYEERLKEKLRDLPPEWNERLAREVVLYADKCDITEELVRLRAHISQFFLVMQSPDRGVGRTLEFLLQEMQREVNTIAAKTADSRISLQAVKVKSELKKIHEQVQNIE